MVLNMTSRAWNDIVKGGCDAAVGHVRHLVQHALERSPERCVEVRCGEAKVILPRSLGVSPNSMTDFAGDELGTPVRFGRCRSG